MSELIPTAPFSSLFLQELVRQLRAQDTYNHWEGKRDEEILAPYVLDAEARKALPLMADPDPDVLWHLELYYNAVGIAVERRTGVMVEPMIKMHHEGFGRVVLIAGRLVVGNKYLRDVHRFGFDSLAKLAEQGEQLVDEAVSMIERFADVVNYQ